MHRCGQQHGESGLACCLLTRAVVQAQVWAGEDTAVQNEGQSLGICRVEEARPMLCTPCPRDSVAAALTRKGQRRRFLLPGL